MIVGFERTKTYLHIFRENRCCGRGLARAGIVTFVSCLLATVITKIPLVNRILNWIPFLNSIVYADTDSKLLRVGKCPRCPH